MSTLSTSYQLLQRTLKLPCGAILKNRLGKSAMSDSLGDGQGNPTNAQIRLYERWNDSGVAISFIGEVQCDSRYPEKPGNLVINEKTNFELLSQLANKAIVNSAHIWPQLGHAGALSHLPISHPKGPSEINVEGLSCDEMPLHEIESLPEIYAKAAILAKNAGFSGVHIHAGHGFLLSQFLSPLFNSRKDDYGGSIEARSRIILKIVDKVRLAVGNSFPIGIRINSSDQIAGGLTEEDALKTIKLLTKASVDLFDISGGTYFPGAESSSESTGDEVYFLDFARQVKNLTDVPLMVTGGFKTRKQAIDAMEEGVADVIGLGRAMILNPNLPQVWFSELGGDPDFPRFDSVVPGGITAWYTMRMSAIAQEQEDEFDLDLESAIKEYEKRDSKRCLKWCKKFPNHSVDHVG